MTNKEIKYVLFLEVFCPEDESKRPPKEIYNNAKKLLDEGAPLSMIFECVEDAERRKRLIDLAEELEKQG